MYKIFNHSSEKMSEISDGSIDLVITDPPYGIGIKYSDFTDEVSTETYFAMLRTVIKETGRVIKEDGKIAFLSPLRLRIDGKDFEFRDIIEREFKSVGLNLIEERDFIIHKDRNAVSIKNWDKEDRKDMHSVELRLIVFSRQDFEFSHPKEAMKIIFKKSQEHPCAFSSEFAGFLADSYCRSGFNVLDPFMGIARLGEKVIQREGNFFGYEMRKEYFEAAKERLDGASGK